jgi:hypothetical protein
MFNTMTLGELFTTEDMIEILRDAVEINAHQLIVNERIAELGHPIPLRSHLGHWEQMRLDQATMIADAVA